ncbi:MAG: CPBP family intramembrane metalloprotease, partial [Brachybacterium sp.]|nr:CPBP family intramembrane metalloprotease [Brachybacterium sp.]
ITDQFAEAGAPMSTTTAVMLVLAIAAIGLLITVLPALGEEIGWRGYLWQRLKPLGFTGAITVGGVAWSLWHLPVVLIGHNYPGLARPWAIAMFIVACVAMNYLFGAITERAGGNPIPAAFAHSTLNSTLGLVLGIIATSETPEAMSWVIDTPIGLTGIVLMTLLAALVMPRAARRTFGPHPEVPSFGTGATTARAGATSGRTPGGGSGGE